MLAPNLPNVPPPATLPGIGTPSPCDALDRVRAALATGDDPLAVITALTPANGEDALRWVRFLPAFEEYHREFPAQVIGVAAVIARRAMREHRLAMRPDGRVAPAWPEGRSHPPPQVTGTFTVTVQGQEVRVEYVRDYFPLTRTDHFQFTSSHSPPRPLPMSPTGFLSHFAPAEQVDALGGPRAYVERLCGSLAAGREIDFRATLEGEWPKTKGTVRGKRTARKVEEVTSLPPVPPSRRVSSPPALPTPPSGERTLFDDEPPDY